MTIARASSDVSASEKKFFVLTGAKRTLGWVGRLARAIRNRNSILAMREFDDAQLADIGLRRSDIETALLSRDGQDPFVYLVRSRQDPLRGLKRL